MSGAVYEICSCCGLVQSLPVVPSGHRAVCASCTAPLEDPRRHPPDWTLTFAAALGAAILFPMAITLPIMDLERFGHHTLASIWSGSFGLLARGEWFVGLVVLLCSVVLPALKLVSLLVITGFGGRLARHHRVRTWRVLEVAGRWGMMDVLLIAVLVAWLKLGDLVRVTPGPGAIAFTACVLASLVASASFDPRALWNREAQSGSVSPS